MIAHKIVQVEDTVCKSCSQCWQNECRAFAMWGSVDEWKHRKSGIRQCQHFDIPAETKKFIEENNRIFVIFEGVCPVCGENLKMKSIGGMPEFLEQWDVPSYIEPNVWLKAVDAVGGIEWVCPHQHVHYVEKTTSGDWA